MLSAHVQAPTYTFRVMDYKKIAGMRIAQARRAKGMTQEQLADRLPGVSASRIGNYEQGTRYPDPPTFRALSRVLEEPAGWLSAVEDDESLLNLSRKYVRMDQRGKDTLHRVAESQPTPYSGSDQDQEQEESA